MRHAASRHLYAYWNRLRRDRPAPQRSEIDPAAIRDILSYTFMLELDENLGFPIRLAGARINALFNHELKGSSFITLWREREAASMAVLLPRILYHACPIVARVTAAPSGHDESAFELLLLPLACDTMAQGRILGTLAGFDHPAWLGLLPVEHLTLRSLRQLPHMTRNDSASPQQDLPTARARIRQNLAVFPSGGQPVSRYGHLRVYSGGRQDALA